MDSGQRNTTTGAAAAAAAVPPPPPPPPPNKHKQHRRANNNKSSVPSMDEVFAQNNFLGDEAESTLIQVLEERRQRAAYTYTSDHNAHTMPWSPAVEGERPPLSRYPLPPSPNNNNHNHNMNQPTTGSGSSPPRWSRKKRTFADVAQRIRQLKKHSDSLKHLDCSTTDTDNIPSNNMDWLLTTNKSDKNHAPNSGKTGDGTSSDLLSSSAPDKDTTDRHDAMDTFLSSDDPTDAVTDQMDDEDGRSEERLPLTAVEGQPREKRSWFSVSSGTTTNQGNKGPGLSCWAVVCKVLNIKALWHEMGRFLRHFLVFGLPCIVGAFVCFYQLGRPHPDFLPHNTSISWWLLFLARQSVTLELAVLTQFIIMDALALRTKWAAKFWSPFVTLCVIQAKGWPFVITCKFDSFDTDATTLWQT
eukprot:scaffold9911_cov48-Attheya_sp.AAC.1